MDDQSLVGKKVAVLVETEYIHDEIEYYRARVRELGGGEITLLAHLWDQKPMDLVNDIDSPDRPVTSVYRLTVKECVTKHRPEEFAVIICAANYVAVRLREIPPMHSLGSPQTTRSAPAVEFFARAMANPNIVKAAMCHALWLLTPRPDLLKGRRVICHTVVLADIHNAGAVFVPDPSNVVIDGDLVTARSFADVVPYFDAIINTVRTLSPPDPSPAAVLERTANKIVRTLETRFTEAESHFRPDVRPVSSAAGALLAGTLDVAAEIKRFTGVDFDPAKARGRKPIILVASKFGTWASELTLVAGTLLRAGYQVKIATEDGSPPHLLSVSLQPTFEDGAWRCPVVSPEERGLALQFLDPGKPEHELLAPGNILNLGSLARPPQVGDYLHDRSLLGTYAASLTRTMALVDEHEAIIVAGGSGAIPGWMADRGLQSLLLAFHDLGKPIMGECNGGLAIAQTVDPRTGASILYGRAVTTHSWLDEYQKGWGWVSNAPLDLGQFWTAGRFDMGAYAAAETWTSPGVGGNPIIDSEALFENAAGPGGIFFSPAGTPYSVAVDDHLITCRTTPDGYPGVLALMAVLNGNPPLRGRWFIDADAPGRAEP